MLVYLINIFLILFFGYLFLNRFPSEQNKKAFCGIVAVQWILISGLRHWSIGADTHAYYISFVRVRDLPWSKAFDNLFGYLFKGYEVKDPGYNIFQKAFRIFTTDYQLFLVLIACIFTILMAIWICRNSDDPIFSFILYSTLFYEFFAVTGHRQTIATALVVFWGYKYIKERKLFKFALIAFLAFLIHKSSVVFAPFYFLANIPISPLYVFIAIVAILCVFISGESLYGVIVKNLGFNEEYLEYKEGGAETYALLLILLSVAILLFYNYYRKYDKQKATHIFNATLLTLGSSLLVFQNQGFMRIQQYYALFLMISVPEFLKGFENKSKKIIYASFVIILIAYLTIKNPPYQFFFM